MKGSTRRPYSERWSEEQTIAFIEVRISLDDTFTNKLVTIKDAWELVGRKSNLRADWKRLKKKWSNLIDQYKYIKKMSAGVAAIAGTGNPARHSSTNWPYYDLLHQYYSKDSNIYPVIKLEYDSNSLKLPDVIAPQASQSSAPSSLSTPSRSPSPLISAEKTTGNAPTVYSDSRPTPSQYSARENEQDERTKREIELHRSQLQTAKELRKAAKLFSLFLKKKYDLEDPSDSE